MATLEQGCLFFCLRLGSPGCHNNGQVHSSSPNPAGGSPSFPVGKPLPSARPALDPKISEES